MSYVTTRLVGLYDSAAGNSQYIRPGCCHESRRKIEENIDVTVMESGREVITKKADDQIETIELTFSNLQKEDESDGTNTLRGFDSLYTFFTSTVGFYNLMKYKRKGSSAIASIDVRFWQADLTYSVQYADNSTLREGRYEFKVVLRRVI